MLSNTRFFLKCLTDIPLKRSFFFGQLAYAHNTRFFQSVLLNMQRKHSFFLKTAKIKFIKRSSELHIMAKSNMKNAIFEDDFIYFLNFQIFLGFFYKKKAKDPPESTIWHFFMKIAFFEDHLLFCKINNLQIIYR